MSDRYANENSNNPDSMPMPRVVYPNDILPDENSLSDISKQGQQAEVKCSGSNPRG